MIIPLVVGLKQATPACCHTTRAQVLDIINIRCSRCSITLYPIQGCWVTFHYFEAKLMVAVLAKSAPINKILPYLADFFWLVPQLVGQSIIIIRFLFINFKTVNLVQFTFCKLNCTAIQIDEYVFVVLNSE
jgi:hypothetical protein